MTVTIPAWVLPLIAVAIYAVGMWVIRKKQNGETFDLNKFLQAIGLGAVATVALYLANGVVPDVNAVITMMEQYAAAGAINTGTLAGIGAVAWGLFDQYILRGKATGTPLISSVTTVTPAVTPTAGSPSFAAGLATVLGLCRDSVDSSAPVASMSFDVNQIPNLLYQMQCITTGKVMTAIFVDGINLTDSGEEGIDFKTVGQKVTRPFFLPQKLRTPGDHVVTVKLGHLVGQQSESGSGDSSVVWDTSSMFSLKLTGVKQE